VKTAIQSKSTATPTEVAAGRSQYVICLAGHIDHGKSALVRALTGSTVDRLPEEQRRGITIELGFSHFEADGSRFALIDVPGHERFIHTMVAGASGVDAALLVVAADDSVMPQTREHLSVLELLGVQHGVVAITKCDLADDEQLEMVEMEIDELVAPTFLHDAPRIRVSVKSGSGAGDVRQAIVNAARSSPARATEDPRFRLPVDRAFSATGQGAVVTGTVWRGTARVGDTLHILPGKVPVRIRRLQSQGADVGQVTAGERAAVNLAGVKVSEIERGHELATPNAFEPATRHLVQLRVLGDAPRPLKHRQKVRFHVAASQVTAQILMGQRAVAPGESAFAIVRCEAPVVVEYGQPFVIRQLSPATTIGGGSVIGPALRPAERQSRALAAAAGLASIDPTERLAAWIDLHRDASFGEDCESFIGFGQSQCERIVRALESRDEVVRIPGPELCCVSATHFRKLRAQLVRRCQAELERRRPARFVLLSVILSAMQRHAPGEVLNVLLKDMVAKGELELRGERIGLPTGAELSNRQRSVLTAFVADISQAGATPPTLKEFAERHGLPLPEVEAVVQVAIDEGQLIRLTPQLTMDRAALEALRQELVKHFQNSPTAKVGEIREQWGITRKHAVPIFEFFDEQRITSRAGDIRSPGPCLETPIDEATT
jgi:selenocysteine-specific elongation factor